MIHITSTHRIGLSSGFIIISLLVSGVLPIAGCFDSLSTSNNSLDGATTTTSSRTRTSDLHKMARDDGDDDAAKRILVLSSSRQEDFDDESFCSSSRTSNDAVEISFSRTTGLKTLSHCHGRRYRFRRSLLRLLGGGTTDDVDGHEEEDPHDKQTDIIEKENRTSNDLERSNDSTTTTNADASTIADDTLKHNINDDNEDEVSREGVQPVAEEEEESVSSPSLLNNINASTAASSTSTTSTFLERIRKRVQHRTRKIRNRQGSRGTKRKRRIASNNETNATKKMKTSYNQYSILKSRPRKDGDNNNNREDVDSLTEFWFNLPSFFRMGNVFQDIYDLGVGNDNNSTATTTRNRSKATNNETETEGLSSLLSIFSARGTNTTSRSTTTSKRQLFLDWIAVVSERLVKIDSADVADDESSELYSDEVTEQSDLTRPGRTIHIVTTAALPWMTGTSVNPLLRAAYLCRMTKKINEQEFNNIKNNSTSSDGEKKQKAPKHYVTLVVPWLELEDDRLELYGPSHTFTSPTDQEHYIRNWMRQQAGLVEEADPRTGIKILFYNARYHHGLKSIFAMGDICSIIVKDSERNNEDVDVCILEEPEHLNWYRAPGTGWTKTFKYVVGIMHTNYKEYAAGHYSGLWTSPAIGIMSSAMVRAYCHKVVKLSDTLQTYAPEKEQVSNVHGVRQDFLKEGQRRALASSKNENDNTGIVDADDDSDGGPRGSSGEVYFIGKILWAKGFDKLIDLEDYYRQCTGDYFSIDIYGNGPDEDDIKRAFAGRNWKIHLSSTDEDDDDDDEEEVEEDDVEENEEEMAANKNELEVDDQKSSLDWAQQKFESLSRKLKTATEKRSYELKRSIPKSRFEVLRQHPIPANFKGRVDHSLLREQYKIFVNPSVSEVLCTTTAEALAMGKFAIIPIHPSNEFFMKFPNCLAYRNKLEFAANLKWALTHDPEPLSNELPYEFTWEAATERFVKAAAITRREAHLRHKLRRSKLDERIAYFHNELGKGVKGDALRRVLGGGPISHQVKYSMEQQENNKSSDKDTTTSSSSPSSSSSSPSLSLQAT